MTGEPITKEAWKDAWREARRHLQGSDRRDSLIAEMVDVLWLLRHSDEYNARLYRAVAYAATRRVDWLTLPLRIRKEIRGEWPHLVALLRTACRAGVA